MAIVSIGIAQAMYSTRSYPSNLRFRDNMLASDATRGLGMISASLAACYLGDMTYLEYVPFSTTDQPAARAIPAEGGMLIIDAVRMSQRDLGATGYMAA